MPSTDNDSIVVTRNDGITTIRLNRPTKRNAIDGEMFANLPRCLRDAAEDNSSMAVITGTGNYYSSGNDIGNFINAEYGDPKELCSKAREKLMDFVASFIDFPKPLVAVVNGPAVGIAVTTLSLCDLVYATETATFHTPLVSLGMAAEACSSYTFPKMMGSAKATEILVLGKKITAAEACSLNLVTEVFPEQTFQAEVWHRLKRYAALPRNAVIGSKRLMRHHENEILHSANRRECALLYQLWQSEEFMEAVMNFFQKKSKL